MYLAFIAILLTMVLYIVVVNRTALKSRNKIKLVILFSMLGAISMSYGISSYKNNAPYIELQNAFLSSNGLVCDFNNEETIVSDEDFKLVDGILSNKVLIIPIRDCKRVIPKNELRKQDEIRQLLRE